MKNANRITRPGGYEGRTETASRPSARVDRLVLMKVGREGGMQMVEFNYSELEGRIIAKFGSRKKFAKAFGTSTGTLSMLLNGKTKWTSDKIYKAQQLLEIEPESVSVYFFTPKVHIM